MKILKFLYTALTHFIEVRHTVTESQKKVKRKIWLYGKIHNENIYQ